MAKLSLMFGSNNVLKIDSYCWWRSVHDDIYRQHLVVVVVVVVDSMTTCLARCRLKVALLLSFNLVNHLEWATANIYKVALPVRLRLNINYNKNVTLKHQKSDSSLSYQAILSVVRLLYMKMKINDDDSTHKHSTAHSTAMVVVLERWW